MYSLGEVWTRGMIENSLKLAYEIFKRPIKNREIKEYEDMPPITTILKKMNTTSMKKVWEIIKKNYEIF